VLAGVTAAELDRAWDLFGQALHELGRRPVACETTGQREAVLWAKATAAVAVPALEGANALWSVWEDAVDQELQAALVEFLLDQERWERALPEHRPEVERQIVGRARALMDRWDAEGRSRARRSDPAQRAASEPMCSSKARAPLPATTQSPRNGIFDRRSSKGS
jgi:hypothetical protein